MSSCVCTGNAYLWSAADTYTEDDADKDTVIRHQHFGLWTCLEKFVDF